MIHLKYLWWDFRGWLRRLPEKLAWKAAWMLPRKVALFAFVRVYGAWGHCGPDFEPVYKTWEHAKPR